MSALLFFSAQGYNYQGYNYRTSSGRAHDSGSMVSVAAFTHFGAQFSTQSLLFRDNGIHESHL
jgi:hypothetical protein